MDILSESVFIMADKFQTEFIAYERIVQYTKVPQEKYSSEV